MAIQPYGNSYVHNNDSLIDISYMEPIKQLYKYTLEDIENISYEEAEETRVLDIFISMYIMHNRVTYNKETKRLYETLYFRFADIANLETIPLLRYSSNLERCWKVMKRFMDHQSSFSLEFDEGYNGSSVTMKIAKSLLESFRDANPIVTTDRIEFSDDHNKRDEISIPFVVCKGIVKYYINRKIELKADMVDIIEDEKEHLASSEWEEKTWEIYIDSFK